MRKMYIYKTDKNGTITKIGEREDRTPEVKIDLPLHTVGKMTKAVNAAAEVLETAQDTGMTPRAAEYISDLMAWIISYAATTAAIVKGREGEDIRFLVNAMMDDFDEIINED